MDTDYIKRQLRNMETTQKLDTAPHNLLGTGSTLLNLAISSSLGGGWCKGAAIWFVGDSSSGKTWFSLTCMAEATLNKQFDDYDFIFDPSEGGASMDFARYFGEKMAERVMTPYADGSASQSVEQFYAALYNRLEAVTKGKARPFIWVEDSMDALTSKVEKTAFDTNRKKQAGAKDKQTMGDGKAAKNSQSLRQIVPLLRKTGCILIMISQTRENFDPMAFYDTAAGGRSLEFYSDIVVWSKCGSDIQKEIRGKKLQIGKYVKLRIGKNRVSGKMWRCEVPFYWSHGLDDIGGCVDFLVDQGHWKKTGEGRIAAPEFGATGAYREQLVQRVDNPEDYNELKLLVKEVWDDIEANAHVDRKPRY